MMYVFFIVAVLIAAVSMDRSERATGERAVDNERKNDSTEVVDLSGEDMEEAARRHVEDNGPAKRATIPPPRWEPKPKPKSVTAQALEKTLAQREDEERWKTAFRIHGNGDWHRFDEWRTWMENNGMTSQDLVDRRIDDDKSRSGANI